MAEPTDEFELFQRTLARQQNGKIKNTCPVDIQMLLENQRMICATLSILARGGRVPMETARELQERAKRITKILEG